MKSLTPHSSSFDIARGSHEIKNLGSFIPYPFSCRSQDPSSTLIPKGGVGVGLRGCGVIKLEILHKDLAAPFWLLG